jgi:hypothetical protein
MIRDTPKMHTETVMCKSLHSFETKDLGNSLHENIMVLGAAKLKANVVCALLGSGI